MTADEVVAEISRRAWRFGVAVLLYPEVNVDCDGLPAGGYFDEDKMVLAVATGRQPDTWLGVLLHEYCHLTQFIEGQPSWAAYKNDLWEWLDGKSIKDTAASLESVRAVEADCERRAIRLARELDAPIDLERYAKASNAYLHFHNVLLNERKWIRKGVVLGEREDVLKHCNPTIDKDFSKTPAKLYKALLTCV